MKLTHNESVVIRLRFGIGVDDAMTYTEIAEVIGVSKTMVRLLEQKALRKLRLPYNSKKMLDIAETVAIINASKYQ